MLRRLPSRPGGYTLDLDSTALLHEDGHQEGVRAGYSRRGLKPCHHPLIAILAEVKMVAGYWLRSVQTEIPGVEIQECDGQRPGQRLIVIRQRIAERPEAGGKLLFDLPGYRYQALITNLPRSHSALEVWRTYIERADCENRIQDVGAQFGIRGICCKKFWATETAHQLAIAAYNVCVLLQPELGITQKVELRTLRMHLFARTAVSSRPGNRPTLKISIPETFHEWWSQILERINSPIPPGLIQCNAAESIGA